MANNVNDIVYEAHQTKKVKIFNPDFEDFTVKWNGVPYTIHAQEIEAFDAPVANHIKRHLANKLMGQTNIVYPSEADWQKIFNKIEVDYYAK